MMMRKSRELPYVLEDRTGSHAASDFDDIYDRIFFRVAPSPRKTDSEGTLLIYDIGTRSSSLGSQFHVQRKPSVVLQFGANGSLGTITYDQASSIPMNQYLRRTSLFAGSLSRKFTASDGNSFKWTHRTVSGQEWSCLDSENNVIAHYNLRSPDKFAVGTSGNIMTITTPFVHLTLELLTTLTIMRHIAAHNL